MDKEISFAADWERRCAERKRLENTPIIVVVPQEAPAPEKLYSIYKRSLPVGLNRPVFLNLTFEEVLSSLKRLKTKRTEDSSHSRVTYYDMVAQSNPVEISPFYNTGKNVLE